MRIVLDLQGCQSASRRQDIGRYSHSLAKAIIENAGEHEIWIVLSDLFPDTVDPIRYEFSELMPAERIVVMSLPGPASALKAFPWRARAAELIREHAIAELAPDIVHISSLLEGYTNDSTTSVRQLDERPLIAVTYYDLVQCLDQDVHLTHPGTRKFYDRKSEFYDRKINMLREADLLLAVSDYARAEVTRELGIPVERVVNISYGISDLFDPDYADAKSAGLVAARYGLSRSFVMSTGIAESHSNIEGLFAAYVRLPEDIRVGHQLFLVCQATEVDRYRRLAERAGLCDDDMVLTSSVPDEDLVSLYKASRLFVLSSLQEGFGLRAIEAMRCGTAVIGPNAMSLPEVIGRSDALYDPRDPGAMAHLIQRALTDDTFRESLRAHGIQYSTRFSWGETGRRAMQAFADAVARRDSATAQVQAPGCSGAQLYDNLMQKLSAIPFASNDADLAAAASAIALNQRVERARELLVDVSVLSGFDAKSGIQRVTRAIVMQLLAKPPSGYRVRPVRVDHATKAYRYADSFCAALGFPIREAEPADDWVDSGFGDCFLGLDLAIDTIPASRGWFKAQHRRGVQLFFVVYDLLPVHRPEWFWEGMVQFFPPWLETLGDVADGLIGISEDVVNEFRKRYEEYPPKRCKPLTFGHFHLGADIHSTNPTMGLADDSDSVFAQLNARPSFLMVGTVEPRKGYFQALSAFEKLWSEGTDTNLVIVGKPGWHQEALIESISRHPEAGKRLIWLQGISDEYLERVYEACTCLLAASEGEGFGLPLIEAAQKGLPIIARDLPVFREVAAEYAWYFRGTEPDVLATAVSDWLVLHAEGRTPTSSGMPWLNWEQSAVQLIDVMLDQTRRA